MSKLYLPTSIFVLSQLFFQIVPLLYSVFFREVDGVHVEKALFANSLALVLFLFATVLFHKKAKERPQYFFPRENTLLYLSFLVVLCCPLSLFLHSVIASVNPFFVALQGGGFLEIAEARELYMKQLPVQYILLFVVFEKLLPMLFVPLNFALYYETKKSKYLILGSLCVFYLLVGGLFSISKLSPVIAVGVLVFSIATIKNYNAVFFYLRTLLFGLFLLAMMGVLIRGVDGDFSQLQAIMRDLFMRRILVVHSFVMSTYFEIFPEYSEFLYGKGIRLVAIMMGEGSFQLANFVYTEKYPGVLSSGWLNSGYIAEAWADFGWFGVVLYPVILAYLLTKVGRFIQSHYQVSMPTAVFFNLMSCFIAFYLSISSLLSTTLLIVAFATFMLKYILFSRREIK